MGYLEFETLAHGAAAAHAAALARTATLTHLDSSGFLAGTPCLGACPGAIRPFTLFFTSLTLAAGLLGAVFTLLPCFALLLAALALAADLFGTGGAGLACFALCHGSLALAHGTGLLAVARPGGLGNKGNNHDGCDYTCNNDD